VQIKKWLSFRADAKPCFRTKQDRAVFVKVTKWNLFQWAEE
jgi:hypothetical protein